MQNPLTDKLRVIIDNLIENPLAIDFVHPYEGDENYDRIILNKMSLSAVKVKLELGQYTTHQLFFEDLNIIWKNCQHYNQQGSIIHKQSEYFEKICCSLRMQCDYEFKKKSKKKESTKPEQFDYKLKKKPSDDEQRLKLQQSIVSGSIEKVIKIMNYLAQYQPEAISRVGNKIHVDPKKVDFQHCEQVNQF